MTCGGACQGRIGSIVNKGRFPAGLPGTRMSVSEWGRLQWHVSWGVSMCRL